MEFPKPVQQVNIQGGFRCADGDAAMLQACTGLEFFFCGAELGHGGGNPHIELFALRCQTDTAVGADEQRTAYLLLQ